MMFPEGRCEARQAEGTVISGKNGARRDWKPRNGNIENDVAR